MTLKYTAEQTIGSAMTTELNSLATATAAVSSAAISNDAETGERYPLAEFELYIAAQGTNRSASSHIELYIIPEVDDTNYGDTTDECLDNYLVVNPGLNAGASPVAYTWKVDDGALAARYLVITDVRIPPGDFKVAIKQTTGQTFAASGNTLKYRMYSYTDA